MAVAIKLDDRGSVFFRQERAGWNVQLFRVWKFRTMEAFLAHGIGCRDYFQPIHLQPFIQERLGTARGQYPVTESVSERTIALPFFPQMARQQVQQVVESLSRAILR